MALSFRFAARSDVGLLRSHNEDSAYAGPRLLVVADGMGGAAAGEVASSVAIATVSQLDNDSPGPDLLDHLTASVQTANDHLHDMQVGDPDLRGMGTTVTALLRAGGRLGLLHIGDSRAYLLREGQLEQITHDHTFVQSLVDEGRISAEEANHHPQRSVITNVLDGRGRIDPDVSVREARVGDRYLVCSDGLSGVVSEQTLSETLGAGDPDTAAEALIALALRGGGPDNITAIVADVVETGDAPPSAVPIAVGAVAEAQPVRDDASTPAAKAAMLAREDDDLDDLPAEEPHRGKALRRSVIGVLVLLLLAGLGYGGWAWSQSQYYVGVSDEQVAIFRGLSQDIGPISTGHVYERQDIALSDLPQYTRDQVQGSIDANDLPDARRIVSTLRDEAQACQRARAAATAKPTPTPRPTAAGTATPRPATSPTARPTVSPSPTATPSATASPSPTTSLSAADCGVGQ